MKVSIYHSQYYIIIIIKVGDKSLLNSQVKVLTEIRNNPNITKPELAKLCNLGKTTVDNAISNLKKLNYIKRVGSNKNGYWEVLNIDNN